MSGNPVPGNTESFKGTGFTVEPGSHSKVEDNKIENTDPNGIKILESVRPDVVFRRVFDWELDVLTEGDQSTVQAVVFTCAGIAAGTAQNILSLYIEYADKKPMNGGELLGAVIFIISACVAITCIVLSPRKRSAALEKKQEIRDRPMSTITGNITHNPVR